MQCRAPTRRVGRGLLLVVGLLGVLLPARPSRAEEKGEPRFYAPSPIIDPAPRRISVGLIAGYGFTLDTAPVSGLNVLGMTFGVRGGYDIDPVYLGARLQFFLGDTRSVPEGELEFDETTIGIEAGLRLASGAFTIQPQLGFGLAMSSAELPDGSGQTNDRSSDDAYLAPGVVVMRDLTHRVFLGAEAHVPIIFHNTGVLYGFTLLVAGGCRF
jgi:hypothetical protein